MNALRPAPKMEAVRRVLVILSALAALAGCGGSSGGSSNASVASQASAESCLRERGFSISEKPDLGAASLPADDWFDANRGSSSVTVAYFSDERAAGAAKKQLTAITKSLAKGFGVDMTDDQLRNVLRQKDRVLYFWPDTEAAYADDVEACLQG